MSARAEPYPSGDQEAWSPMQVLGSGLTILGGAAFIASFFLKYINNVSLWHLATEHESLVSLREPLILTILAALAVLLALAAVTSDATALCVGQAIIGCYLFGQAFSFGLRSYSHLQVGFWTEAIGGLAMAVGGTMALIGNVQHRSASRVKPRALIAAAVVLRARQAPRRRFSCLAP